MVSLFFNKSSKQFRGFIALSFLLARLLGTHWIGFAHGINHSGIHHERIGQDYEHQEPTLGHSSASCHLFDALTLAGFIASDSNLSSAQKIFAQAISGSNYLIPACIHVGLYQSRAPPAFIL